MEPKSKPTEQEIQMLTSKLDMISELGMEINKILEEYKKKADQVFLEYQCYISNAVQHHYDRIEDNLPRDEFDGIFEVLYKQNHVPKH